MFRSLTPFIAFGLVSSVIMIALGLLFVGPSDEGAFRESKFEYLKSVANLKSDRIDAFLSEKMRDVEFLADSSEISDSLDEELVADTAQVTEMVKRISKEVAAEINEFMLKNPSATIQDLVNNPEFRDIAMRRVGETGYTVFHGPDTIINYIHWDPEEEGDDHKDVFERDPEGQQAKLLRLAVDNTEDVSGFYTKKQSDGSLREKFMYISMIPTKTADNVRVAAQATVYLDDFGKTLKLAKDLDERLQSFGETKEYRDMILVDLDGNIVWTAAKKNDLGSNLNRGVYRDTQLAKAYHQSKDELKTIVSDPGYYEASDEAAIFVASPVFDDRDSDDRKLKGIIVLQLKSEEIENIIGDGLGADTNGEVYVVNKAGVHITSTRGETEEHGSEMTHVIRSSQIDRCFNEMKYGGVKSDFRLSDFVKYENYVGSPVFGVYQFVNQPDWCVIAELDSSEVENGQLFAFDWRVVMIILATMLGVSIIVGLIVNRSQAK